MTDRPPNKKRGAPSLRTLPFGSASGQSLVEMSVLVPMLLLILLGAIELGRYAYSGILLANAARAGAGYGSQSQFTAADLPGITAAVCNDFQGASTCGLTVSKSYLCQCDSAGTIGSSIDCTSGTCSAGQREVVSLEVTVTGTFDSLFKYPGIPQSITVTKTAIMRIQ